MARPLTDDEQNIFAAIQNAPNIALVQTTFDGEDTAVIAAINDDEATGGFIVTPLAVLVTDAIMTRLADPATEPGPAEDQKHYTPEDLEADSFGPGQPEDHEGWKHYTPEDLEADSFGDG